jgi:hypothetical protein
MLIRYNYIYKLDELWFMWLLNFGRIEGNWWIFSNWYILFKMTGIDKFFIGFVRMC